MMNSVALPGIGGVGFLLLYIGVSAALTLLAFSVGSCMLVGIGSV